jgi:NAD(P)-dependent dehydrogenase (short-subunit alcohol dehydrogenase family)
VSRYGLYGKVALITGGARGIGFGVAEALHARGSRVVLVDVQGEAVADAAARLGAEVAIGVAADVTDRAAIQRAVDTAVQRFGGVDIVVANAGIAPTLATARAMSEDEFERVVEVDLLGVYRTVRAALPQIVARHGQAVLISSVYAFMNGMLLSPYAVAKAGVEQLGRALRVELAPHGASATVAYFGFVDTHMVQDGFHADPLAGRGAGQLPAFLRKRISAREAGNAIAGALERRRPRVIEPRVWTGLWVLQGALNPLQDLLASKRPHLQGLVREADVENRILR